MTQTAIPEDEYKLRVWHLIARRDFTPDAAEARIRSRYRPAKPAGRCRRLHDGFSEQRAKPRINPMVAQRMILALMSGRGYGKRGGSSHHGYAGSHRTPNPLTYTDARRIIFAKHCIMGTWEDIQAWGDHLTRKYAGVTI